MTQKSLRYTHEKSCKNEVTDMNEIPVKRRTKRESTTYNNIDNTDKKDIFKTYTSPKDEPQEEPTSSNKVKKVVELVKCPKCNKMMTQKSLKYILMKNFVKMK